MNDLRDAIRASIEKRNWEQFHSPKDLAMALSVEVSEVVEHFQWLTQQESRNLPVDNSAEVREEIGARYATGLEALRAYPGMEKVLERHIGDVLREALNVAQ